MKQEQVELIYSRGSCRICIFLTDGRANECHVLPSDATQRQCWKCAPLNMDAAQFMHHHRYFGASHGTFLAILYGR
ncbi:hypothetical protein DM806_18305 [Sphingobium lactosutens]|nr:hypothetical protein [Sphingobium lactosutens]